MILKEMFKAQLKFDNSIIEGRKLQGKDLFKNKALAAIIELSECANEIRFFKYWSNKGPSSKEVILEEYVDCLHFVLSMGNDLKQNYIIERDYRPCLSYADFTEDFLLIHSSIINFSGAMTMKEQRIAEIYYIEIVEQLLGAAYKMGFTEKEIEMAYYKKNEINFKRQATGY